MNALTPMPTRAGTRQLLEASPVGFDVDAWHVMDKRDNALIEDELLHGSITRKFIYEFKIQETQVTGISVVGARQLGYHYGGLKHRIVGSTLKQGRVFKFTSYPSPGSPMNVQVAVLPELEDEPDSYAALVEILDIKTGNAIQMESSENRYESRRDGSLYDRPHYVKIAQAKAYRNAVLALLPQDVQLQWKAQCLELQDKFVITEDVLQEKQRGILQFAAKHAIPVSRPALAAIGFDQIAGLSDAARGGLEQFRASLSALGLAQVVGEVEPPVVPLRSRAPAPPSPKSTPPSTATAGPGGPSGGSGGPAAPPPAGTTSEAPRPGAAGALLLLGAKGENLGAHQDPVSWAHAFVKLMDDAFPADRDALQFSNEATVLDAANASAEAMDILAEFLPEPRHQVIQLRRSPRGQPLTGEYLNDIKGALPLLGADDMPGWHAANAAVWGGLPAARRLEVEREVAARCQTLGIPVPGAQAGEAEREVPRDQDRDRADAMIRDLEACPDVHQLDQYCRSPAYTTPLARFAMDRPELHTEITRAEQAARHGLAS